jgi:hypothetical protein
MAICAHCHHIGTLEAFMAPNWQDSSQSSRTPRNQAQSDRRIFRLLRKRQAIVVGTIVVIVFLAIMTIAL